MEQSKELEKLLKLSLVQHMPRDTKECVGSLFLRVSKKMTLSDGDIMFHQGELGGASGFVLLNGSVVIDKEEADLITVSAPALLGEMYQFNPQPQRSATVRVKGQADVLRFAWQDLYDRAKEDLAQAQQAMLVDGIEQLVWNRFDRETLLDIALLRGLDDKLRLRTCLLLQWIAKSLLLGDGETLFRKGDICGGAGYLLTRGAIVLDREENALPPQVIQAPNLLGVMLKFDPDQQWTATATAQGDTQVLKFSWQVYTALLQQRLSPDEQRALQDSIQAHAAEHFMH